MPVQDMKLYRPQAHLPDPDRAVLQQVWFIFSLSSFPKLYLKLILQTEAKLRMQNSMRRLAALPQRSVLQLAHHCNKVKRVHSVICGPQQQHCESLIQSFSGESNWLRWHEMGEVQLRRKGKGCCRLKEKALSTNQCCPALCILWKIRPSTAHHLRPEINAAE